MPSLRFASRLSLVLALAAAGWSGLSAQSSPPAWPANRQYSVALLQNSTAVEGAYDIIKEEFEKAGLVEGRNLNLNYSTAMGDFATLASLVDSSVEDGANLIFALQTVTLQTALRRAGSTPLVFHVVSDPFLAGVGTSDTEKLPNVTGSYFGDIGAETQVIRLQLLRSIVPAAKRIGILFSPADVESVRSKDSMTEAAKQLGLEVEAVPVTSADQLTESLLALVGRRVDAIQMVNSSVISASFPVVLQVARRNRLPVFGHSATHVLLGSIAAYVPDTDESARQAARMAVRVLRGESPATIPLVKVQNFALHVNAKSAASLGLKIPEETLKKAKTVHP